MAYKISGTDITPYLAFGGVKATILAVEGPNAGRMQNGEMVRDLVAYKYRFDMTCRLLTAYEKNIIMQLLQPEFFPFTYDDLFTGVERTDLFYSNNIPSSFLMFDSKGNELWNGISFPVIMK